MNNQLLQINERLRLLLDLFIESSNLTNNQLYDRALDIAVKITHSKIGFFHLISPDETEIILTTWNSEALKNCKSTEETHYPITAAGNWADCLRQQQTVIYNSFAHSPNQKGLPTGHTPIQRLMSIPVIHDHKAKMIFGVGNKDVDYDDFDVQQIESVAVELYKILEKRKTENALSQKEHQLSQIAENSFDLLALLNTNLAFDYANKAFETMLGYEPKELAGRRLLDLILPEDRSMAQQSFDKIMLKDYNTAATTVRMVSKTQQSIWFGLRISIVERQNANMLVVLLNGRNLTTLKDIENQLQNELAFSKSIFNSTEAHYAIVNPSGEIIAVNEAWRKFGRQNGIANEETKWGVGANYFAVCQKANDASSNHILKIIQSVQSGQYKTREAEYPCHSPDEYRWYWMRVSQLFSNPGHVLIAHVDISERKKSELALREDKKILGVLNKLMSDYVFKLTPQPNGQFQMTIIAGNYTEATGRAIDEARTNDQWTKIIHPEDRPFFDLKFQQILTEKMPVEFECRSLVNDNSIRWLEIVASPDLDENNNILAILGSVRNITAKKAAEKRIKEGEKKYKELIENLHAGVVVHNPDTSILFCNKEASLLLGLSEEQLKGKAAFDPDWYFTNESGIKLTEQEYPVLRVIETRKPLKNNTYGINRPYTNDQVWVQVSAYPELDENQLIKEIVVTFINITERKLAEEEIKVKEQKYRNIFENVRDVYYEASIDGVILDLSPSIELVTNGQFKNHELIGKHLSEYYADPSEREKLISELSIHGNVTDFEVQFKNKNGSFETTSLTSALVFDDNGKPIKVVGSLRNITKRKQDEERLRKSEERWKSIINTSPDGISIASLDGKIQFITNNLVKWHGYDSPEEIIGKTAIDFVTPSSRELARNRLADMLNGSYSGAAEYELLRKDGSTFFVEVNAEFLRDKNGNPESIIMVERDITQRIKAEEALRKSEILLNETQKISRIGGWDYDLKSNITSFTNGISDIFGTTIESLDQALSYFDTEDEKRVRDALNQAISEGKPFDLEARLMNARHEHLWIKTLGRPLTADQQTTKVITTLMDITESKLLEDTQAFLLRCGWANSGNDFFEELAHYLSSTLDNCLVWITQINTQGQWIELATNQPTNKLPNSPETVQSLQNIANQSLIIKSDLQSQFPDLHFLKEVNAESWHCIRLFNSKGETIGHIMLISQSPISDEARLEKTMNMVGFRTAGELERRKAEAELKMALEQLNDTNAYLEERVETRTEEIKQLSSLHKAIFDNASFAILTTDNNGLFQTLNPAGEAMFGYSGKELIGKHTPLIMHDRDELDRTYKQITGKKAQNNEELFLPISNLITNKTTEWTWIKKDGSKFQAKVSHNTMYNAQGEPKGFMGIIIDITHEKQAIDALRQSEERFHNMFHQHAAVMLLINQENGEIIEANQAAQNYYGYDFNGAKKLSILDINMSDPSILKQNIKQANNNYKNYFIFTHKLASGETRNVEVHSTPIELRGTSVLFSIVHDITERIRVEQALINSQKTLTQITDSVPVFIALANKNLEYTFANKAYELFFGLSKDQILGKKIIEVIGEKAYANAYPYLVETLKGATSTFENTVTNVLGETRIIYTTYLPYYQNNEINGILATVIDITERIKAEQNLQKSEAENRAIVSAIPDLLFRIGKDGTYLDSHSHIESTLYVPRELFIGKKISEVLPPDLATKSMEIIKQAFEQKNTISYEYSLNIQDELKFFENRVIAISSDEVLSIIRDITNRKVAENELQETTHKLSTLIQSLQAGTLFEDPNRKISLVNQTYCDMFGIQSPPEMLIGFDCVEASNVSKSLMNDPDEFIKGTETILKKGELITNDELQLKDGKVFERDYTPIYLKNKLIGHLWQYRDITYRKRVEAALKMQSNAFESFALPIIITDIAGKITWANTAFIKLTGYSLAEAMAKTPGELFKSGKQNEEFYTKMLSTIKANKVWTGELINKRKNGTHYFEEETITPVLDHLGQISGFIAIKIDITERKAMEQALLENEARWNFALESSGDGVWDWNTENNEVFYSNQWKQMFGFTEHEISNSFHEWETRIHPEDKPNCMHQLENHLQGLIDYYKAEYRFLTKDGSYKWVYDRGKVYEKNEEGKPFRVVGTCTDITDRKRFEQSLKESIEREKELNDLKSRFVSMASHEFRTPLTAILMASETLLAYRQKLDEHQIAVKLQSIIDQVSHLSTIVKNVMQVSKIQEGKETFEPQLADIVDFCKKVIEDFNADESLQPKITFTCSLKILELAFDKRLMLQIMNNLLSNAIKYAQPNPIVTVSLYLANDSMVICIQDNGIGIPTEDQKRLFEPFFRATNTRQIPGHGLGLNIVNEAVQMHGGFIKLKSQPGFGSEFFVYLPKALITDPNF